MKKKVKIEDPQKAPEKVVQIFLLVLFLIFVLKNLLFPHTGVTNVNVKEIKKTHALYE